MANDKVFDGDGHVVEKEQVLLDYFDPPYRGNTRLLDSAFYPTLDGWHRQANSIADGTKGRQSQPYDVGAWLSMMDRAGIEHAVIYPSRGLGVGFLRDPEWAVAVCRAYNNFLAENYIKASARVHGMALLPMQDPEEAVKELNRCVSQLKMLGGVIAPVGLPFPAGHPNYHPVYAEAERLDCVIGIHGAPATGLGLDHLTKLIQARVLTHPFAQMVHLTSIVLEGVLQKYPKLRLLSLEAGACWLAFLLDRLDWEWEKRGSHQAPLLKKMPSEYLKSGQVFINCDVKERIIPALISLVGEECLFYASDYPHERDQQETIAYLRSREDLSETAKDRILYHNAKRCYRVN